MVGFVVIVFITFFLLVTRAFINFSIILLAASGMLKRMTERVMRTSIVFFDQNPIGRIMTRFSKDMVILDQLLALNMMILTHGAFKVLVVIVAISIINPFLLIPIVFSFALMVWIQRMGTPTMIET